MKTPAELAEIYQNATSEASRKGETAVVPWIILEDDVKTARIAGMQAALTALFDSVGDGMPSVGDCHKAWMSAPPSGSTLGSIRDLMLTAFAKKLDSITRPSRAILEAHKSSNVDWPAFRELEKALGIFPAVEPAPAITADPFTKLKAEHKAGKVIQISNLYDDCFSDFDKGEERWSDCEPQWATNRRYRVKPEQANKWAAEKAAFAQGKKIEAKLNENDQWTPLDDPQFDDPDLEYRAAPDEEWIPLEASDVPPGSAIRDAGVTDTYRMVTSLEISGGNLLVFYAPPVEPENAEYLFNNCEIRRPGCAWQPCKKLKTTTL